MRQSLAFVITILASSVFGQSAAPQTARQALIEMFFGQAADHLEKHLPEITRHSMNKLSSPGGENYLSEFSSIAMQARAGGAKFQTFDTGPTLLLTEDPNPGLNGTEPDKVEITVERDDLIGDEDQIELALHLSRNGKEQSLPVIPRFTFIMQSEANVWRLNEISVTVRVPLADPNFLKSMEDQQRARNEQRTIMWIQQVNMAQKRYSAMQGRFACSLSVLGGQARGGGAYLYDPELVKGSKDGYVYVISGCDPSHYKIVAEPAVADSEQRAFCSDEDGDIRAAADGKATTCLSSGDVVQKAIAETIPKVAIPPAGASNTAELNVVIPAEKASSGVVGPTPAPRSKLPQRVRVSQGVIQRLKVSDVPPSYPVEAKQAGVQGLVILAAVVGKDGSIQSLKVLNSPSPVLSQAAMDAVRQWKYRPYVLNGTPVEVDTQITVNFTLSH
jgi:TonB family protein